MDEEEGEVGDLMEIPEEEEVELDEELLGCTQDAHFSSKSWEWRREGHRVSIIKRCAPKTA